MGPIRLIAVGAALVMVALAISDRLDSVLAVPLMVVAAVITVLDNGLAFTAIPEIAGPYWSGRAMGAQNTTQRLTSGVGPPVFGEVIDASGYPLAFALCGVAALAALPVVPRDVRSAESADASSDGPNGR